MAATISLGSPVSDADKFAWLDKFEAQSRANTATTNVKTRLVAAIKMERDPSSSSGLSNIDCTMCCPTDAGACKICLLVTTCPIWCPVYTVCHLCK